MTVPDPQHIITLCGSVPNDCDCEYCLNGYECRLEREKICTGCLREGMCPAEFKRKRAEEGYCRGREMRE